MSIDSAAVKLRKNCAGQKYKLRATLGFIIFCALIVRLSSTIDMASVSFSAFSYTSYYPAIPNSLSMGVAE